METHHSTETQFDEIELNRIQILPEEVGPLNKFILSEINAGAVKIGIFGGRTIDTPPKEDSDIDVILIKDGIRPGGECKDFGLIHATYLPSDYKSDSRATFAHQITENATWLYEEEA